MNEELQQLADHCFEISQEVLAMNGEFHPFGAFIGESGRVHPLGIELEPKNIPNNGQIINQLINLAKELGIENYALCFEVSIQLSEDTPPTDAICVNFTYPESPKFYQPFNKSEDELNFEEIFGVK